MKFRLIDRITSWTPHERICGVKAVSFEEYSLKAAFDDEARLPETLLLESFLQLGNWLILLSSGFTRMGLVAKLAEVRFKDFLRPGQQLSLEVHLHQQRDDGFVMSGEGRVGTRPIITGLEALAVSVPAADYVDPEDLRVMFSEIYRPSGEEAQ